MSSVEGQFFNAKESHQHLIGPTSQNFEFRHIFLVQRTSNYISIFIPLLQKLILTHLKEIPRNADTFAHLHTTRARCDDTRGVVFSVRTFETSLLLR